MWEVLYTQYSERVRRFVFWLGRGRGLDLESIVNDVWLIVWQKPEILPIEDDRLPFILGIARVRVAAACRDQRRAQRWRYDLCFPGGVAGEFRRRRQLTPLQQLILREEIAATCVDFSKLGWDFETAGKREKNRARARAFRSGLDPVGKSRVATKFREWRAKRSQEQVERDRAKARELQRLKRSLMSEAELEEERRKMRERARARSRRQEKDGTKPPPIPPGGARFVGSVGAVVDAAAQVDRRAADLHVA